MPNTVGSLISDTLNRVRDPNGLGHTRANALTLINHVARIVNAFTGDVKSSATLSTLRQLQMYSISAELPSAMNVIGVTHRGRHLSNISLDDLRAVDSEWPRAIGNQYETFSVVGKDLLILYPALPEADSVTVYYSKNLAELDNEADSLENPPHNDHVIVDTLEVILLMRQRDFSEAEIKMQLVMERFSG
jgi:hypothetical protein